MARTHYRLSTKKLVKTCAATKPSNSKLEARPSPQPTPLPGDALDAVTKIRTAAHQFDQSRLDPRDLCGGSAVFGCRQAMHRYWADFHYPGLC